MEKKKLKMTLAILLMFLGLIAIVLATLAFLTHNQTPKSTYTTQKNPLADLSDEQAIAYFNETFVKYLLYTINADALHNPPLSSNTPKIQIEVSNDVYFAEINKNAISVSKSASENKDIIITTTKEEAVKMLRDKSYVATSFADGKSSIQLVASKTDLFLKGYLEIYKQFS